MKTTFTPKFKNFVGLVVVGRRILLLEGRGRLLSWPARSQVPGVSPRALKFKSSVRESEFLKRGETGYLRLFWQKSPVIIDLYK